eukprot:scaffold107300_cov31-Tisochrysis_lutea.AAC.2
MELLEEEDPERYQTQFSSYIEREIEGDSLEEMYQKAHEKVRLPMRSSTAHIPLDAFLVSPSALPVAVRRSARTLSTRRQRRRTRIRRGMSRFRRRMRSARPPSRPRRRR